VVVFFVCAGHPEAGFVGGVVVAEGGVAVDEEEDALFADGGAGGDEADGKAERGGLGRVGQFDGLDAGGLAYFAFVDVVVATDDGEDVFLAGLGEVFR